MPRTHSSIRPRRHGDHRSARLPIFVLVATLTLCWASVARANDPPDTPLFTEPSVDGKIVNPFDVHMETAPFADSDPGDLHACSDWEIWLVSSPARVWYAPCVTGVLRVHIHLGDGTFEGPYDGRNTLEYDTDYLLRVRHRDSSGTPNEWSAWGERRARTGPSTAIYPLLIDDVLDLPAPTWRESAGGGTAVVLPAGAPASELRLESPGGALLYSEAGHDGSTNLVTNPAPLSGDSSVRIVIDAGATLGGLARAESEIVFTDNRGFDRVAYLPSLSLGVGEQAYFWLAADGSTYVGAEDQTEPDFSTLARGAPVPWVVRQPGYRVEIVATGFQLPTSIAFVPNPGPSPNDPLYYVGELYGSIKVVRRNGVVSDYATGLLDYDPLGPFPGSGEQGLGGIVVEPVSGDVFASLLYDGGPALYPKVIRLSSTDGGLTATSQSTVIDMVGEAQGASHQISNLTFGPDGKLYVHVGDGFNAATAQNLSSFRGKILRLELDGSPATDNPFYAPGDGITARDHVFAYGFRNAFGGAWSPVDGAHYVVENGPSVDRLARIVAGRNYGWNGSDASMRTFALYNWDPATAPVNIAFVHPDVLGGSGFPPAKMGHAFISESGPTYASGPQSNGKRISEVSFDATGNLQGAPVPLIEYGGTGRATAVGLAAGPDGLYFTDLYKDHDAATPVDVGANVLRISFLGRADFTSDAVFGTAPLTVRFFDASLVPNASAWAWDFGDGATSSEQNPTHTYDADGVYDVTLSVTGSNGVRTARKAGHVCVGTACGQGLRGEYYRDIGLADLAFTRIDPVVDFSWGAGSPDPAIESDNFSVRWTGRVKPDKTQNYRFYTVSDDGVRLWVNNRLLIDKWIDQSPTEWSGSIPLTAGLSYDVTLEYYERGGGADVRLSWSSPTMAKQPIPATHLEPRQPVLPPPSCPATPDPACTTPLTSGRSKISIRRPAGVPSAKDKLVFTWGAGRASVLADFGNPMSSTGYALCVYDGASSLVSESRIAAGGSCGRSGRPCWKTNGKTFTYADASAAAAGIQSVKLKPGVDGKAQISVTAKGSALATPALPLDASGAVQVQVRNVDDRCWSAAFATPSRNDARTFIAKGG